MDLQTDNYKYTETIQIILGQTVTLSNENFESSSSWIVGGDEDNASRGIWERVEPNATYEYDQIVQPGSDHTENGSYCFITENSSNQNNPGETDVDGGKTTLYSPIYDLSMHDIVLVSYWKWYTNNLGNNPGTDYWMVDISNNGGNSWVSLENTTESNNYWVQKWIEKDMFSDNDDETKSEQETAYQALLDAAAAEAVRKDRNERLSKTDWLGLSDVTMSTAWAAYRQALRDVPAQNGFPNSITWPTEP